jgi:hypothetical protein
LLKSPVSDYPKGTGAALLGQRDAFPLALLDLVALKLRDGSQDREHEVCHRRILAGKGQVLLDEL